MDKDKDKLIKTVRMEINRVAVEVHQVVATNAVTLWHCLRPEKRLN
jgi:hypothetical protein